MYKNMFQKDKEIKNKKF